MSSTRPPPVSGKWGNLAVSVTAQPEEPTSSPEPESSGSEFSTPPTSPRSEDSHESPPSSPTAPAPRERDPPPPPVVDSVPAPLVTTVSPLLPAPTSPRAEDSHESPPSAPPPPAQRAPPSPPVDSFPTPPLVRTVSPLLQAPTSPHASQCAGDSHESLLSTPPALGQRASPAPPIDLVSTRPPTAPMSPRVEYLHESPPSTPPESEQRAPPPLPVDSVPTLPSVGMVSLLFAAEKLSQPLPVQMPLPQLVEAVSTPLQAPELCPHPPPPVQVPPAQFEKASPASDGSVLALFWDTVARVQEAHASLDEHISRWFGLDQSKYQWALNEYYESTGKEIDSGNSGKASNQKEHSCKVQNV